MNIVTKYHSTFYLNSVFLFYILNRNMNSKNSDFFDENHALPFFLLIILGAAFAHEEGIYGSLITGISLPVLGLDYFLVK